MSRLVSLVALTIVLLGAGPALPQDTSPAAQAYAETDAGFRAIKDNVATARERLGNVGEQLGRIEDYLETHPELAPAKRAALMRQLGEARGTLQTSGQVLDSFGAYADKVTQAADAVNQVRDLATAIRSERLSDQLRALGAAMEGYGGDVPLIGPAIEAYGRITAGLVDATDRLDAQIGETFRQEQIGSAVHGGKDDPRYKKLVEQFGKEFADQTTYAPSTLREVFRPIDKPRDTALIWDPDAGAWYRVDGNVPVETIFGDVVAARGKRPTPAQLRHLAENHAQTQARQAVADGFAGYLRAAADPGSLGPSSGALIRLGEEGGRVMLALRDPAFRARFTYDGTFRAWTLDVIDRMRADLVKQGRSAQRSLQDLDALLERYEIAMTTPDSLPEIGTVRVVAWFPENPKDKFRSTWRFDGSAVSITVHGVGRAQGTRTGNVVHSTGTANGCTSREVGTFLANGRTTFTGTYTCTHKQGTTTSTGSGVGRWEVISAEPPAGRKQP